MLVMGNYFLSISCWSMAFIFVNLMLAMGNYFCQSHAGQGQLFLSISLLAMAD
jgi:hypothetical protein